MSPHCPIPAPLLTEAQAPDSFTPSEEQGTLLFTGAPELAGFKNDPPSQFFGLAEIDLSGSGAAAPPAKELRSSYEPFEFLFSVNTDLQKLR